MGIFWSKTKDRPPLRQCRWQQIDTPPQGQTELLRNGFEEFWDVLARNFDNPYPWQGERRLPSPILHPLVPYPVSGDGSAAGTTGGWDELWESDNRGKHLDEKSMRLNAGEDASPATDFGRLMTLYQRGDRTAVTVLVESLSPQLYRFFASQLGSRTDAEDMLQDTWLRIHRVRHTYRPGEPLLPWIYAIARRVRVDHYRKRQRIASRETPADMLPELPAPEKEPNRLLSFEELVASLPESQREVLVMLKVNDLSIEEVACSMSSTVGAVKQKAHRAYQRLRKLLEQAPGAEAEPSCPTLH